jgi:hypothetical protein
MNSIQTEVESTEKPKKASRKVLWVAIAILLIPAIPAGLFLFDEWQRATLLRAYSLAAASTNLPSQPGVWSTAHILQSKEVMACVLNAYGRAEDLPKLNAKQKASLPKLKLPSEDGTWYLLVFSEHQIERVALYPLDTSNLVFADDSCGGPTSSFSISPRPVSPAGRELVISFITK